MHSQLLPITSKCGLEVLRRLMLSLLRRSALARHAMHHFMYLAVVGKKDVFLCFDRCLGVRVWNKVGAAFMMNTNKKNGPFGRLSGKIAKHGSVMTTMENTAAEADLNQTAPHSDTGNAVKNGSTGGSAI